MGKPKINCHFGLSPTDLLVRAWLTEHDIDPGDVLGYRINRPGSDVPTIELTMIYSETEVATDGVQAG